MAEAGDATALAADLASADSGRRLRALEALLAAGGPPPAALLGELVACVGDGRKAVQRRAAEVLARIEDRAAVRAALEAVLADAAAERRWGAAYALGVVSGAERRLLPALLEALGHPDGDRRWAAADLVVALGRREPLDGDLLSLAGEGNAAQRKMALYCLRDLGAHAADIEAAVLRALGDVDPGVRLAALAALGRCLRSAAAAAAAVRALETDVEPGVRRAAASALGWLTEHAAAREALARATASSDTGVRRAAEGALRRAGEGRGA